MKKRTKKETLRQINGLKASKKSLPKYSVFGDNNWEKIAAQIAVLEGRHNANHYYFDETSDDYEEVENEVYFAAARAEDWLNGSRDEDLF